MISWLGIAIAAAGCFMIVSSRGSGNRGHRMAIAALLGLGMVMTLVGLLND